MKVTIVGMWNSFPNGTEPTSGYLLEKDGFRILLDAGSGIAGGIQKYINIHDLDYIILSHYHHDHAGDADLAQSLKRGPCRRAWCIHEADHAKVASIPADHHGGPPLVAELFDSGGNRLRQGRQAISAEHLGLADLHCIVFDPSDHTLSGQAAKPGRSRQRRTTKTLRAVAHNRAGQGMIA